MMKMIVPSLFFLLPWCAFADIGPKPTQHYQWKRKGLIDHDSIQLLQCKDSECKESEPLQKLGPQHFSCCISGCESIAYGYSVVSQLEGKVDGRKVKSKPFKTEGMSNYFEVSEVKGKISVSPAKKPFSEAEMEKIRGCRQ